MAQEVFYSLEELGFEGAKEKAAKLAANGYKIIEITHGMNYQAGALSTPYAANYGEKEPGWRIVVDDGRPHYESDFKETITLP
ncbi:hypothetical protein IKE98_01200 [Candidatus Saccharibacteria bacterium]|nr:hypothetical protein [Candidatus Saccharibacteria bacterium]